MKSYAEATNCLSTLDRLDQIRMRPEERVVARAYLRQAELLADILLRADAGLRRAIGLVGRGFGAFARRSQASAATPDRNEWSTP